MSSQTDQMDMPEVFEEFRTAQHSAMCEVSKVVKESVDRMDPVSYTHLDVYKRQLLHW